MQFTGIFHPVIVIVIHWIDKIVGSTGKLQNHELVDFQFSNLFEVHNLVREPQLVLNLSSRKIYPQKIRPTTGFISLK
jgi:hypothetical protein